MFLVIKTGFSFLQTFADFGFKKELLQTALLLDELRSLRCLNLLEQAVFRNCSVGVLVRGVGYSFFRNARPNINYVI